MEPMTPRSPRRQRLATVWLAGCSGCHMSFLDLDEWLLELAQQADIVYSPVACDRKDYPEAVDICLVEGGVGNTDNLVLIQQVRANTTVLVSFGDCAVTANIPGMRNMLEGADPVLRRAYLELRRSYEPSRVLSPRTIDLDGELRRIIAVLEEAYEILRDAARRERYRRAIEAAPGDPF